MEKISQKLPRLLKMIKNNIKLYVFDYDGTIFDAKNKKFGHKRAFLLIKQVLLKNKSCLILTARCASFIDLHLKNLEKVYKKNKGIKPIFIGGGNGNILYEYSDKCFIKKFDNGLSFEEVKTIMKSGIKIYKDFGLQTKDLNKFGMKIHKSFLKKNWSKLIPGNFSKYNKIYKGICFSEEAKVAFVLPDNLESHNRIITLFKNKINQNFENKYSVIKGDNIFLQINHSYKTDPKLYALKIIIKKLNLNDNQLVVFGNMPEGNDRGILIDSHLPFTFIDLGVELVHEFVFKSLQ